jgi:hypothetical protein
MFLIKKKIKGINEVFESTQSKTKKFQVLKYRPILSMVY